MNKRKNLAVTPNDIAYTTKAALDSVIYHSIMDGNVYGGNGLKALQMAQEAAEAILKHYKLVRRK